MPKSEQRLTTKAFSQKAGVSPATVSNWLKKGKIKGKKEGAKWLIAASELNKVGDAKQAAAKETTPAKVKSAPKRKKAAKPKTSILLKKPASHNSKPMPDGKSFSVEAFSDMTYLTTYGVEKWLKEGRLIAAVDASGRKRVDATNLENAHVKRLLR